MIQVEKLHLGVLYCSANAWDSDGLNSALLFTMPAKNASGNIGQKKGSRDYYSSFVNESQFKTLTVHLKPNLPAQARCDAFLAATCRNIQNSQPL
jgi:hypothetical protein